MPRRLVVMVSIAAMVLSAGPPAGAHSVTAESNVTRSRTPSGRVERATKMVVIGQVRSVDAVCRSGVTVELVRVRPGRERVVAREVTDGAGRYLFLRRPRKPQTVRVRFPGFTYAGSGHTHVCAGGLSRELRIRVKRKG